jgi:mannosyltransferase OCH1-like enzyme
MPKRQPSFPIPKIIHQIWLGPEKPPVKWMHSWLEKNPDWEYRLWTENNMPHLHNQKKFDQINTFSGKADIARVEILYQEGGIYLDADSECLNALDDSLRVHPCFACYEHEMLKPGLIQTGVLGCKPKHPLMLEMIQAIAAIEDVNEREPWFEVGPFLFTRIVRFYEIYHGAIKILPSYLFFPIHYWGACYAGEEKVYATHHWISTTGKAYKDSLFCYPPPLE